MSARKAAGDGDEVPAPEHLSRVESQWDHLGRTDPLWAVLSDPEKRHHGWSEEEFFAGGVVEIASVLDHARQAHYTILPRRALDFGCGVGRLTQAMAGHFERCDGVDIAPSMLERARRSNRFPDKCHYHLNRANNLALFEDSSFDFVYSVLVLQHMRPQLAKHYIAEFVRVLTPGGLLVFQAPSYEGPDEPPTDAPRTETRRPLPEAGFRAEVAVDPTKLTGPAGGTLNLEVRVRNLSSERWPSLARADRKYQICLGGRWLSEEGSPCRVEGARCPLPFDLLPGGEVRVFLPVLLPQTDGCYTLEIDMLQEGVAWFASRGSTAVRIEWGVSGGTRPARAVSGTSRGDLRKASPSFRERHPHLVVALRASRLGVVYRAAGELVGAARREAVWFWSHAWRRPRVRDVDFLMDMHFLPRSEVVQVLETAGAEVLEIEHALLPGALHSRRYWVTRRP